MNKNLRSSLSIRSSDVKIVTKLSSVLFVAFKSIFIFANQLIDFIMFETPDEPSKDTQKVVESVYLIFLKQLFKNASSQVFYGKVLTEKDFIERLDKFPDTNMYFLDCAFIRDVKTMTQKQMAEERKKVL